MRHLSLILAVALWATPALSRDWPRGPVDVMDFSGDAPLVLVLRYQKLIRAVDQLLPADLPQRAQILDQLNRPLGLDPTLVDFTKPIFLSFGEGLEQGRGGVLTAKVDLEAKVAAPLRARAFLPSRAPKALAPALEQLLKGLGAEALEGGGFSAPGLLGIPAFAIRLSVEEGGVRAVAYFMGTEASRRAALAAPASEPVAPLETTAVKATRQPYSALSLLVRPNKLRPLAISSGASQAIEALAYVDKPQLKAIQRAAYAILLQAEANLSGAAPEVEEVTFDLRAGANEIRLVLTATLTPLGVRLFDEVRPTIGGHLEVAGPAPIGGLVNLDFQAMGALIEGNRAFAKMTEVGEMARAIQECGVACNALALSSPISLIKDGLRLIPEAQRPPIPLGAQWVLRLDDKGKPTIGIAFIFVGQEPRDAFKGWLKKAKIFKGFTFAEEIFGAYQTLLVAKGAKPISFFAGLSHQRKSFFKLDIAVDALPKMLEAFKLKGTLGPLEATLKDNRMLKVHLTREDDAIFGEILIGRTEHNRRLVERGFPTGKRVAAAQARPADGCMVDVSVGLLRALDAAKSAPPVRFGALMADGVKALAKEIRCAEAAPEYQAAIRGLQARIVGLVTELPPAPTPASLPAKP